MSYLKCNSKKWYAFSLKCSNWKRKRVCTRSMSLQLHHIYIRVKCYHTLCDVIIISATFCNGSMILSDYFILVYSYSTVDFIEFSSFCMRNQVHSMGFHHTIPLVDKNRNKFRNSEIYLIESNSVQWFDWKSPLFINQISECFVVLETQKMRTLFIALKSVWLVDSCTNVTQFMLWFITNS